jgi:hypothetical protein
MNMRDALKKVLPLAGACVFLISLSGLAFGQTPPALPSGGLQQRGFIFVPNWAPTGTSVDVPSFNRQTGVMYLADRNNFGATALDMNTLSYIGTIEVPNCRGVSTCSPSGVLVIPDLQKLIITDRDTHIFIYDLRAPGQGPTILTGPPGQDELDYDPINQRAYIGNTGSSFAETVVDMKNNRVLGSIALDTAPEQSRFNPVDGMIYVNVPGSGKLAIIDPQSGPFGAVVNALPTPTGCANAVDIDPVNNTAMLGCSAAPSMIIDLKTGATVQTFANTFGVDIGQFNPHTRRWYMGIRDNAAIGTCGKDTANRWAYMGVFSSSPAQLVGGLCTGLAAKAAGVDPVNNNILVPTTQFPPDANTTATGTAGILVFHDPAPSASGAPAGTIATDVKANLTAVAGSGVTGTLEITLRGRREFADVTANGLPASSTSVRVVVETTAGHETVPCGVSGSGAAFCQGYLIGDPLIGAPVNVGSGSTRVASGTLGTPTTIPAFIPEKASALE